MIVAATLESDKQTQLCEFCDESTHRNITFKFLYCCCCFEGLVKPQVAQYQKFSCAARKVGSKLISNSGVKHTASKKECADFCSGETFSFNIIHPAVETNI